VAKLDLEGRVREALSNAKQNGYNFEGMSASEIATDLMDHDSDLEGKDFPAITLIVHNHITVRGNERWGRTTKN